MKFNRRKTLNRVALRAFGAAQRYFERGSTAEGEERGRKFGRLAFRLDKKHRLATIRNLGLAFPNLSDRERMDLARRTYDHFGILTADFMRSEFRDNDEILRTTEVIGLENLDQALAIDAGVIVVTAHLGNWERFAQVSTAKGFPITVVARDPDNNELQERVLKMREHTGVRVLSRGNAARAMLGELRKKRLVGILPDQNDDECFVPFFGHPAGTVLGPAVLHQRTGAALLPAYCVRTGVGQYLALAKPVVDPDRTIGEASEIMAELNLALESVIREYPDQYLWLHDRWKSARRRGLLQSVPVG